jgi:hypothetical protein
MPHTEEEITSWFQNVEGNILRGRYFNRLYGEIKGEGLREAKELIQKKYRQAIQGIRREI